MAVVMETIIQDLVMEMLMEMAMEDLAPVLVITATPIQVSMIVKLYQMEMVTVTVMAGII